MAISTFTTFFTGVNSSILNVASQVVPFLFGLSPTLRNSVDPKYIVKINATGGDYAGAGSWGAIGVLQEKINISVASTWSDIGIFKAGSDNEFLSMAAGLGAKSLVNTFSSRRRWAGSSPISISMKLKFEAENNAKNEVTDLCAKLQGLALPSGGTSFLGGQVFLTPPGPNPWGAGLSGERVSIDIGNKWLYFSNVIVDSVETEFENRMSAGGPIGALVTIKLSTYELVTKASLEAAYNASIIGGMNNISATSVTPTTNTVAQQSALDTIAANQSSFQPAAGS